MITSASASKAKNSSSVNIVQNNSPGDQVGQITVLFILKIANHKLTPYEEFGNNKYNVIEELVLHSMRTSLRTSLMR